MVRIAVDAMGGDYAPREVVHGAVLAAKEFGVSVLLVGPVDLVQAELSRHSVEGLPIELVGATEVIGMDEKPSRAFLKKKDSSIRVATRLVAEGKADGVVAAGSTGAAAVAAQLELGRIDNVDRSAIACFMPTTTESEPCILLDCGANVDCTPLQLFQFALMGSILCEGIFNKSAPRVSVLNIGTEETKGNELVQGAYKLIKESGSLNFIGYTEGRDFPMSKVDVLVTDGFTGNVTLKTAEGIAKMIKVMLKQEVLRTTRTKFGGWMAKPAIDRILARTDYNEFGGALLIGVKGVYVIAHGGSKHTAIKNAVRTARDMVKSNVVQKIESALRPSPNGNTP
jgi:phosphate acyltransferase